MLLKNLSSPRLQFRRLQKEDAVDLLEFFQDAEATRLFPIYQNSPQAHAFARIEYQQDRYDKAGDGLCAIVDRETNAFVGHSGLLWQEVDSIRELEIAYHLQPKHWKKGYASEAAKAIRDFAFENRLAESLVSIIDSRNENSKKVALRNGMRLEKETIKKEVAVSIYRISREEWETIK